MSPAGAPEPPRSTPRSLRERRAAAIGGRRLRGELTGLGDRIDTIPGPLGSVVVGPAGVFVVDARRCPRGPVAVRTDGGRSVLTVGGRDRTPLVAALAGQLAVIRAALSDSAEFLATPIMPALCLVDAALARPDLEVGGVRVRDLAGVRALVTTAGSLDPVERHRLARHLADRLGR